LSTSVSRRYSSRTRHKMAARELCEENAQLRQEIAKLQAGLIKTQLESGTQIFKLQSSNGIDKLTGLKDRTYEVTTFDSETKIAERNGEFMVVAMFDIDHFKKINDTMGHDAGDAALRHFAGLAREMLRPADHFFRHGGEEFLLLARVKKEENAHQVIERLRIKLTELPCYHETLTIPMTVSVGMAITAADEQSTAPKNLELLIKTADEALYKAKDSGRNRIVAASGIIPHEPAHRSKTNNPDGTAPH